MRERRRATPGRIAVLLVSLLLGGCTAVGQQLYDLNFAVQRRQAGLEEKRVTAGGLGIAYAEGGAGETVVMVHGFSADRTNWYPMARHLRADHRVVALDLPPFGESTAPPAPACTVEGHVEHLHAFVDALGLQRFHLVGNSMGGHTAALYAARHPDRVATLALFDAAGVDMPVKSDGVRLLEKGTNAFVVRSDEDADRFFDMLFVDRPFMPSPVLRYFSQREQARSADIARWFDEYYASMVKMEPLLADIRTPTLVLWGDTDRVLDVSSARVWVGGLPDASLVIMKDCGHVPMIERPAETASHYRAFLAAHAR